MPVPAGGDEEVEDGLFTRAELAFYLQIPAVTEDTANLLRDLVTSEIRLHVGESIFDAMTTDLQRSRFKGIALEVVKRSYLNPSGLRSSQIDDYQEVWATETFGGIELTAAEQNRIDRILGRAAGAFTIRPAGTPDCRVPAVGWH